MGYYHRLITWCLDSHTLEAWELERGTSTKLATLSELETFFDGRIRALESVQSRSFKTTTAASKTTPKTKSAARAHAAIVSNSKCSCCSAAHCISSCSKFAAKSLSNRQEFVKNLCFNCLGSHRLSECRTLKRCKLCKGHHTLLHRDVTSSPVASSPVTSSPVSSTPLNSSNTPNTSSSRGATTPIQSHHAAVPFERPQVLLATASIILVSEHGEQVKVRALLDQGSKVSFIRESLVQLLRLPRCRASIPITSVGAQIVGFTRGIVSLCLQSRINPSIEINVSAFILPRVTGQIPTQAVATTSWTHLTDLLLTNPEFAIPGGVDTILGADVYGFRLNLTRTYKCPCRARNLLRMDHLRTCTVINSHFEPGFVHHSLKRRCEPV